VRVAASNSSTTEEDDEGRNARVFGESSDSPKFRAKVHLDDLDWRTLGKSVKEITTTMTKERSRTLRRDAARSGTRAGDPEEQDERESGRARDFFVRPSAYSADDRQRTSRTRWSLPLAPHASACAGTASSPIPNSVILSISTPAPGMSSSPSSWAEPRLKRP